MVAEEEVKISHKGMIKITDQVKDMKIVFKEKGYAKLFFICKVS